MDSSTEHTAICQEDTISIAVMGPTGTGKSSFINLLSGSNMRVGKALESCTDSVQISEPFELSGRTITLIDTPGFDDTKLTDVGVLNMIAAYLAYSHSRNKTLAGVIYLHRILDNRVGGISARSFRLFRNLCGDDSLRNVVIATTMWDKTDEDVAIEREEELASKDVFFKPALQKGARLARHSNTMASAQAIIRSLIGSAASSVTLQIQEELHSGLEIFETRAGKELSREVFEQIDRHREEMRGIMAEIQDATRARDEESRKELAEERVRITSIISKLQIDSTDMVRGYREALAQLEERVKKAEQAARESASRTQTPKEFGLPASSAGNSPIVQAVAATENTNAVLEGKMAAAIPVIGFWGKLAVMLAPFSLTWR
ncbi:P-loop containing nucleoside triphosphate hydrolase protein [Panaeolus papilionaceus]|nr:P-loop containing nucleoside triphosphate hydrolase protein [Panaeolus papilionaceus]